MVNRASGTRDFLPEDMKRRKWVIEKVEKVFQRFGFEPLETPAIERLDTLSGKYGEEGEHLLFKISIGRTQEGELSSNNLGLRYDLTVPLARVIAMNQGLNMPFKRYQIQPVWRAERPQRGRFREFLQCDVDIIGADSALADAECLAVVATSLKELGFRGFSIKLNHRGILRSIADYVGAKGMESQLLIALDKLDKIGKKGVDDELIKRGFSSESTERLWSLLELASINEPFELLAKIEPELDEEGKKGVENLRSILDYAKDLAILEYLQVDLTLARGLSYYTGAVFETVVTEPKIGSISGGGRYDGLIGMFSGQPMPAVGVSLGLERILTVMEELNLFDKVIPGYTDAVVVALIDEALPHALQVSSLFRASGIKVLMPYNSVRMKKVFKLAERAGAPFMVMIGEDEKAKNLVTVKKLSTREQKTLSPEEAVAFINAG